MTSMMRHTTKSGAHVAGMFHVGQSASDALASVVPSCARKAVLLLPLHSRPTAFLSTPLHISARMALLSPILARRCFGPGTVTSPGPQAATNPFVKFPKFCAPLLHPPAHANTQATHADACRSGLSAFLHWPVPMAMP